MSDDSRNFDWQALNQQARKSLPIEALFQHYGHNLKSTTRWVTCPRCEKDGKFKVFPNSGSYSCCVPSCELHSGSGERKLDGPGLVMLEEGLPWKEASWKWMRIAGVLSEDDYQWLTRPEDRPSRKARKKKKAEPKPTPTPEPEPDPEPVAIEEPDLSEEEEILAEPVAHDQNPWTMLWHLMRLADGDRTKLHVERGLDNPTIKLCGFRTSRESNTKHIEVLRQKFTDDELVELGILRNDDERGYRPEPQLCGWGITKEKDPETGKQKFGKTNPILIPYFGENGEVITMRAHKGGLPKRILPGEISHRNYSKPYGEHFLKDKREGWCIITEGELKAAAAYQCGFPVLAVPGISFIANESFREELIRLLRRNSIKRVAIIYDNEVKDDPDLPGYKEDETKRYDVHVWANVLAHHLKHAGIREAKIGKLPDELRVQGKCDFDGILQSKGDQEATRIFRETVEAAQEPNAFVSDLFPSRATQIIASKTIRYTRERMIEIGGEEELTKSYLFRWSEAPLAAALASLNGCYFTRKNVDPKKRETWTKEKKDLTEKLQQLEREGANPSDIRTQRIEIEIRNELLKGWPERVSNFSLTCLYKVKAEETGEFQYYCKAWIPLERRKVYCLIHPRKLSRIADMREFASAALGASWKGGEKDLQAVKEDLDVDAAYQQVNEINSYGAHLDSGLFIFGDCAWDKDGKRILPDKDMVFWHDDQGYQIDTDPNKLGDGFDQKAPMMQPEIPTREDLPAAFQEWATDIRDTTGGYEGWALAGGMIAYLAMPAFWREEGRQHPGIWLHGTYGDGKTKMARWLTRIHGFAQPKGITLGPSTTDVALFRVLAQYSCLAVFLDEYRSFEITDQRNGLLRNAFDGTAAPKGRIDNMRRTRSTIPNTTPIVCGESECDDAATRSRYIQSIVSRSRRAPDPGKERFHRLETMAEDLYQVGRQLLDNRPEFERLFISAYKLWQAEIESKDLGRKINDRAGVTYGVAYAGLAAASLVLGCDELGAEVQTKFLPFLLNYMVVADQDTKATGVIETFWEQILSGIRQGEISARHFERKLVVPHATESGKVSLVNGPVPDNAREIVVINATDAFSQFEEFYRKRGKAFPLSMRNLSKYLRNQDYWVWKHSGSGWKVKFEGKVASAWGMYLDCFPWTEEIDDILREQEGLIAAKEQAA